MVITLSRAAHFTRPHSSSLNCSVPTLNSPLPVLRHVLQWAPYSTWHLRCCCWPATRALPWRLLSASVWGRRWMCGVWGFASLSLLQVGEGHGNRDLGRCVMGCTVLCSGLAALLCAVMLLGQAGAGAMAGCCTAWLEGVLLLDLHCWRNTTTLMLTAPERGLCSLCPVARHQPRSPHSWRRWAPG